MPCLRACRWLAVALVAALLAQSLRAEAPATVPWYRVGPDKSVHLYLYVFHSERCPHCQAALQFLEGLERKYDWLEIYRYETYSTPKNLEHYRWMAQSIGRVAGQVPAFFYCRQMEIGYVSDDTNGRRLEAALVRCHEALVRQVRGATSSNAQALTALVFAIQPPEDPLATRPKSGEEPALNLALPDSTVDVPLWGSVDASRRWGVYYLYLVLYNGSTSHRSERSSSRSSRPSVVAG